MKCTPVKFDQADQTINFVRIVNRFECDVDVKCGSRMADVKSIVGILSPAKSKAVELTLHTDDCDQLTGEIALFAAQSDDRYIFLDLYMNHESGQQRVCCGPVLFLWHGRKGDEAGGRGDHDALWRYHSAGFGREVNRQEREQAGKG